MFRARWDGEALTPTGHYGLSAAREAMEPGDVVIVEIDHPARKTRTGTSLPRSMRHGGTSESLQEAPWAASPETLRKHALIATGFADTYSIDCGAKATAERVRMALASAEAGKHGYAIAKVRGPLVVVWTPQSQSMRAMGGKRFQESKQAVLNWIAAQIGVEAEELRRDVARPTSPCAAPWA